MTVRTIREGNPEWLPGIRIADMPFPLPAGIRLFSKGDLLGIAVDGIVGSFALATGETLQILPKIGQANFLRMLFRSLGLQAALERQFDRFVEYAVDENANLSVLAARQMVASADEILRLGITTKRLRIIRRGSAGSGQILPSQTALALARREADPVVARVRIRSHDSAENRLIAKALTAASALLHGYDRVTALSTFRKWERRVGRSTTHRDDLWAVEERLARMWYGGPRAYYARAVTLALVLLGALGMTAGSTPVVSGEALLLSSSGVFERFVRRVISERYSQLGYIVAKGGSASLSLYQDGTFGIAPDVVIERNSKIVLIADAKYKEPTSDDHYQLLAYMATMGLQRGVLLTPKGGTNTAHITRHRTSAGLAVLVVDLPLDNLDETEKFLQDIVEQCA